MGHISLSQLSHLIKKTLDAHLEPSYWVVAEIGEIRITQKGHCYLELVEKEGEEIVAKLRGNIWAYTFRNLSAWFESITNRPLQAGMKVLVNTVVQFHEVYGLSLVIRDIDPNFTLGERARRRQEVIQKLVDEDVFNMNRELSLPLVPQRIAAISSPTAAGYGDFVNQLTSNPNGYGFQIKLFKALMQGSEATASIIDALHRIHTQWEKWDVVVLIRGGGSQVDLDCFDTYDLAAHIAQFPLPVITGIGHERDETITDLVAHTKLKTPTAVSEFLIGGMGEFENSLRVQLNQLNEKTRKILSNQQNLLQESALHLGFRVNQALRDCSHALDRYSSDLAHAGKVRIRTENTFLDHIVGSRLQKSVEILAKEESRLTHLENSIRLIDPVNVLGRGYSITRYEGQVISLTNSPGENDTISTQTKDSLVESKVTKTQKIH